MKFKEKHRQDILACINKYDIQNDVFSFSKKKGRIILSIDHKGRFSFIEKSDFDIDMKTKERNEISHFEVKHDELELKIVDDWSSVLDLLNQWLSRRQPNFTLHFL